nr:PREDICTED: uncharacterized protein LOC109043290 [Bemisia tabaci]
MESIGVASVFDPQHNSRFIRTFHDYFNNQTLADVCFICKDGQKVRAHQMVLGAVSKLLKKLLLEFAGTMEEIVIHLPDVPSSSLKQVLYLLYEGNTHLVGEEEYKEFNSLLRLLGIEPDNSNTSSRQELGGNKQPHLNPSMDESRVNSQFSSPQHPANVIDHYPNMNQSTPSGPPIQQQMPPQGNVNLPGPMIDHTHSNPGGRIFKSNKRKQTEDPNPGGAKSQNIKTEPPSNDIQNAPQISTSHTGPHPKTNQITDNKSSVSNKMSDSRNVRGRGRPRGSGSSSTRKQTSSVSHRGNRGSQPASSDCVVVDD